MVLTEEERKEREKERNKQYRMLNKEKERERKKKYREENKEKVSEYSKKYRDNNKEYFKKKWIEYSGTEEHRKSYTMGNWRRWGIKGDLEKLYEVRENTTNCNVCNKEFINNKDKHLDHDHETREFRWILCSACNNHDSWKKYFM